MSLSARRIGRTVFRIALRVIVAAVILVVCCVIAGVLVFRSGWFQEKVRERVIAEMSRATGGRVELGTFGFNWTRMEASVGELVIHGKEAAGGPPLVEIPSAALGLRVISALERKVDLAALRVERPSVHIIVYPDGSTNLPDRTQSTSNFNLLDLAVGRYDITDGELVVDNRKTPINLHGEKLRVEMTYQAAPRQYDGVASARVVRLVTPEFGSLELNTASAAFTLHESKIDFSKLHFENGKSEFDLAGTLDDLSAPHGTLTLKASVPIRDAVNLFKLPIEPVGVAAFDGRITVSFANRLEYSLRGKASGRGLAYTQGRLKIENAEASADVTYAPRKLLLRSVSFKGLESTFTGQLDLLNNQDLHLEGRFEGLGIRRAARFATDRTIAWNGSMAGDVVLDAVLGKPAATLQADIVITPAGDGTPLDGHLVGTYEHATHTVRLQDSFVATPATRIDLSGTLGGTGALNATLKVAAKSTDLDDLLPALAMASENAPQQLPIKLLSSNGSATFDGTVSGTLDNPHVKGQVAVLNAAVEGHAFDRFRAEVEADPANLRFQGAALARGTTEIQGSGSIAARAGDFATGTVAAQLNLRNVSLAEIAKEANLKLEDYGSASGMATADIKLSGVLPRPEAEIALTVDKPSAFGEQADRFRANLHYAATTINITAGEVDAGAAKLRFEGAFQHPENDLKNGDVRFDGSARGLTISRSARLAKLQPLVDGAVEGKASGSARIQNGEFHLSALTGDAAAKNLTWDRQPVGDVTLNGETRGNDLTVSANAKVRDVTVQGQGSWRLDGDAPGNASLRFSRVNIDTLHSLVMITGTPEQRASHPSFDGYFDGSATVSVALRKPRDFRAQLTIDALQVNARQGATPRLGVQPQDLVVRNAGPIVVAVTANEARISSAQLIARDTNIEVAGSLPFTGRTGADLTARGTVDLGILQMLNRDLLARGNASLQATIRGSLNDPQINGRMELKNASLYLSDLPSGIDNVNGAVAFDRNRATIDKLTAEAGGGTVTFGGFVEFSDLILYRLQAQAQNVRLRYNDAGVTFNGRLALNGTSDSSTVSGLLTVNRATVDPRTDLGQFLAELARPSAAPTPNDYLRDMQFDVRIESGPNFELQTSLTRNVEAEVDLRLRGTPLRPALLGTISVDQGEIQIFGNKYTINRGDIRFLNPLKIEPTLDLNLETRAHGITVNVAISGSAQKLNVNWSSDPPLQSREIIALLAVGRTPSTTGLAVNQNPSGSTGFADAGGGLLGQAVSQQLSSRLQRFFGASRVKIDPTVTGLDYLPQARLTLEQQVSTDITLTYVTNLNRTQEQIVRVQWDFNKNWSATAVRDANGLFGVDFQYKKRFK